MINKTETIDTELILIVEKGLLNRKMISDALQKDGFYVKFVPDSEAALKAFIQAPPCLILLSLYMPGIDACSFSRILKNDKTTKNIKIVAFSDKNPPLNQMIYCGFDRFLYLEKRQRIFIEEIRSFLDKSEQYC